MEHISTIVENTCKSQEHSISSGFKLIDDMIGGYYPGQLTTVCGDENCGKSAFVIAQLNHIAVDQHVPTLLVMSNMSERIFLACMAAYYCSIETDNINNVLTAEEHSQAVNAYLEKLKEAPLFILDAARKTEAFVNEMLEEMIATHDIKIVFVDEVCQYYDYSTTKRNIINCYKSLALRMNIPVVVTCCVWNDRDGIECARPALRDFFFYNEIHGSDTVIGLIRYGDYGIRVDEHGRDLKDTIGLEILKCKGRLVNRRFYLPWGYLFLKEYADRENSALEFFRKSSGYKIDTLINEFGLIECNSDETHIH